VVKNGQVLQSNRQTATNELVLALLAGFVASVAMVFAFAVAYVAALVIARLPLPLVADWFHGLTNNALIDIAGTNLYAATIAFVIGGLVWGLLYGVVFEPRLRGPGWRRGMSFALIPWLFSLLIFLPLVGGGVLGIGIGAGPLPILGNLMLHAVYGAILGFVYSSGESVFDRPHHQGDSEDLQAGRLHELGAVKGMAAGLILGMLVGVLGAVAVPQNLGFNPMATVLGMALIGTAFGAFVGSLSMS
jgi:hypothetical protein